jgi:hypothetical protein
MRRTLYQPRELKFLPGASSVFSSTTNAIVRSAWCTRELRSASHACPIPRVESPGSALKAPAAKTRYSRSFRVRAVPHRSSGAHRDRLATYGWIYGISEALRITVAEAVRSSARRTLRVV